MSGRCRLSLPSRAGSPGSTAHRRWPSPRPGTEGVAQRVHVRVRADTRIAEQVPGASQRIPPLQDAEAALRTVSPKCQAAPMPESPAPIISTSKCSLSVRTRITASIAVEPGVKEAADRAATIGRPWTTRSRASRRTSARCWPALHEPRPARCSRSSNLPETVKGALFARYSRYPGTLRRLFLDEFADDCGRPTAARVRRRRGRSARRSSTSGSSSATATTRSPSSAAPTSPASGSPTCSPRSSSARGSARTWSSRPATSPTTRRCPPRGRLPLLPRPRARPAVRAAMDELFAIYSAVAAAGDRLGRARSSRAPTTSRRRRTPARSRPRRSTCCAACCPRLALAHGHLRDRPDLRAADPPPARPPAARGRAYGEQILAELQGVMPSFVARVRAPRARRRVGRLPRAARAPASAGPSASASTRRGDDGGPSVRCSAPRATRTTCWPRCCSRPRRRRVGDAATRLAALDGAERAALLADLVGERRNRRHRPGRGFEALRYRFEIVSDYGAFRDLQRHRMLTVQWQSLTPDLGAGVPEQVELAGCGDEYRRALEISRREFERCVDARPAARGAVRALPRLPDPLHPRPQRPRGDAADRAALGARGPPELPRGRARDARADRVTARWCSGRYRRPCRARPSAQRWRRPIRRRDAPTKAVRSGTRRSVGAQAPPKLAVQVEANGELDAAVDVFVKQRSQNIPVTCQRTDKHGEAVFAFAPQKQTTYLIRVAQLANSEQRHVLAARVPAAPGREAARQPRSRPRARRARWHESSTSPRRTRPS